MGYLVLVAVVSVLSGAIAAVSGFGIGSLLTPVLSIPSGIKVAVAAVSIPHFSGTALRFWMMRGQIDRNVLWSFGIPSAAGGLTGALLHTFAKSPALTIVFGGLLVFAGVIGLTGLSDRMRFGRRGAWLAGAISGFLGGLVGNQGGIRSAGLLGFDVPKQAFVATATAIGLIVDGARLPVYLVSEWEQIEGVWPFLVVATSGVVVGTFLGGRVLKRIPESIFRRVVSAVILALGVMMLFRIGQ